MLKQEYFTDISLEIAKYGCYFLCLVYIFESVTGKTLQKQDVLEIFLNCKKNKFVTENCYILEPAKILNFMFKFYNINKSVKLSFITETKENLKDGDFIVSKVRNGFGGTHFIVIDKNLNKVYDPSALIEKKVNNKYYFLSFRIFKIN